MTVWYTVQYIIYSNASVTPELCLFDYDVNSVYKNQLKTYLNFKLQSNGTVHSRIP